ncbi:unnamed protein product, partial [Ranitomeya imitator]
VRLPEHRVFVTQTPLLIDGEIIPAGLRAAVPTLSKDSGERSAVIGASNWPANFDIPMDTAHVAGLDSVGSDVWSTEEPLSAKESGWASFTDFTASIGAKENARSNSPVEMETSTEQMDPLSVNASAQTESKQPLNFCDVLGFDCFTFLPFDLTVNSTGISVELLLQWMLALMVKRSRIQIR